MANPVLVVKGGVFGYPRTQYINYQTSLIIQELGVAFTNDLHTYILTYRHMYIHKKIHRYIHTYIKSYIHSLYYSVFWVKKSIFVVIFRIRDQTNLYIYIYI